MVRVLLKGLQLTNKAIVEAVAIAFTSDAAQLHRKGNTQHTSGGIKIVDLDAIDPDTNTKLFVGDDGEYRNAQSTKNCSLVEMIQSPETKQVMVHVMGDLYRYAEHIAEHGIEAHDGLPAFKPFNVKCTADMKSQWSLAGLGGGFKNEPYPCHLCGCLTKFDDFDECHDDLVCDLHCKPFGRTTCCHRKIDTEDRVEKKTQWLIQVIEEDFIRTNGNNSSLTWRDALPRGPVEVILGFELPEESADESVLDPSEDGLGKISKNHIKYRLSNTSLSKRHLWQRQARQRQTLRQRQRQILSQLLNQ